MPTHLRGLTSSDRNTGLLNAQSLLSEGWTANLLYIQRQGPIVTLQSYRLQGPAGLILTFPSGFRPSTVGAVQFTWTGGAKTRLQLAPADRNR